MSQEIPPEPEFMNPEPQLVVGVITLNEAGRIERCLESLRFAGHCVVLDAGSSDATVPLARALGARVEVRADWRGFAVQRERLLALMMEVHASYFLMIDADEVVSPALRDEILSIVKSGRCGLWTVRWTQVAYGRELRGVVTRKAMPVLYSRGEVTAFYGVVHEYPVLPPGTAVIELKAPLLHFFRETVGDSLRKLTQYALLGAAKRQKNRRRGGVWRGLASGLAMFFRMYVLRRAFMQGGPGFLFSLFAGLEGFFRYAALYYDHEHLNDRVLR